MQLNLEAGNLRIQREVKIGQAKQAAVREMPKLQRGSLTQPFGIAIDRATSRSSLVSPWLNVDLLRGAKSESCGSRRSLARRFHDQTTPT